ncbi:uncharacterized protein [Hoplias malabaricus]|uniref:uncharacterized protein n=1 Tax=Hoplias malabaricus TaxID=27720 RepID=UPI003462EC1F
MVRCGVLTGLVLLSLLSVAISVDIGNLPLIIRYLQNNYGSGDNQFAVAINVPAAKCAAGAVPDQNFLSGDVSQTVKNAMNSDARVYNGQQLIGARPKPIPGKSFYYHSEYLLLIRSNPPNISPDDPLMQKLLNKDPSGCVVFYTFNSPCVKTCSTPTGPHSIIPALDMFRNHNGPKAFVFNRVWRLDIIGDMWKDNIKLVNDRVLVHRCDNTGCIRCVDNNNVVDARCTVN